MSTVHTPSRLFATLAAIGLAVGCATTVPAEAATAHGSRHVIVRSTGTDLGALRALVERAGGHVDRTLGIIQAVAATVPATAVGALQADRGVAEVTPDAAVTLDGSHNDEIGGSDRHYRPAADDNSLYRLESIIGARSVWSRGYTGKGVDIALVDSGVAPVEGIDASNVVQGPDLTEESQDPSTNNMDTFGHGTHLAGIIAGHDPAVTDVAAASNNSTDFLGVAPDARIVSVKVADEHGVSDVSQVIAGIDWVVAHAHDQGMNIRVMNLSFGTDSSQAYTIDPLAYAAEQAWKQGIVVVTSAGNGATAGHRLSDPAVDPFVIAVGADDPNGTVGTWDDSIASFSSIGDGNRNPDLVAPGVHVQSLRDPGSFIDRAFGSTGTINSRFFRGTGTSQAAAIVSGAAALILQQQPGLTADQVKFALVANASSVRGAADSAQGAGLARVQTGYGTIPAAVQTFADATGRGSLELSRGSAHVVTRDGSGDTTDVTGERDVFGHPVSTAKLAREASGGAWRGGSFNGDNWSGSGWTSSSWASSSWRSSFWRSSSWASSSWASSTWASSTWASSTWASSTWASSSWAGVLWAASVWR
ncbi:MAG: S8 family serine peptidase [Jatrophihabitantaceae bacterium]